MDGRTCDHAGQPERDGCRVCWLFFHDERYTRLWTGKNPLPLPTSNPLHRRDCEHMGAIVEYCVGCSGEMRHVRDCAIHEKVTLGTGWAGRNPAMHSCDGCPDFACSSQPPG